MNREIIPFLLGVIGLLVSAVVYIGYSQQNQPLPTTLNPNHPWYQTSATFECSSGIVYIYYDANHNHVKDSGDILMPASKYKTRRYDPNTGTYREVLLLPKGVILYLTGFCREKAHYHCYNTAEKDLSIHLAPYININKMTAECEPHVEDSTYIQIDPRITTLQDKAEVLDSYRSHLYDDIYLTQKYSDNFDFFDVDPSVIPTMDTPMAQDDFENTLDDVLNNIINEVSQSKGYDCSVYTITSSLKELECSKTIVTSYQVPIKDDNGTIIGYETKYSTSTETHKAYLSLEEFYYDLMNKGLYSPEVIPVVKVKYDCPQGVSNPKVAEQVEQYYVSNPGVYECKYYWKPEQNCIFYG